MLASGTQQATFDAISIKPFQPVSGAGGGAMRGGLREDPGRLSANATNMRQLVKLAYGIEDFQLTGVPGWMDTDLFSVDASAPDATGHAAMMRMLQTALADRCHLALTKTEKPTPVYALVPAPGGVRFHASDCIHEDGGVAMACEDAPQVPAGMKRVGEAKSMPQLAEWINRDSIGHLGHPVVDRTGIQGDRYLFYLWARVTWNDAHTSASMEYPDGKAFIAMLEQDLGLTLKLQTEPFPFYTVTHIEHPTAN